MIKPRLLPIAAVGILLAGCAAQPKVWYKADTTVEQFEADKADCSYEAVKHGGSFDPSFGKSYAVAMHRNDIGLACMKHKGYSQEPPKQEPFHPIPLLNNTLKY